MLFINEKIVFKKFLSQNSYFFLLTSLSFTFIVWAIKAVRNLDIVSEDGHSFLIYFYYTFLMFPKIFGQILPLIFFTSLFYSLIKYENNNELKIFWINGINKVNFYNVILRYTFLLFFLQIIITTILGPHMQNKARNYIKNSTMDFFPSLFQEKKFIDTVDKLTIFIESKDRQGGLKNIYLKDDSTTYPRIIVAKSGQLIFENDKRMLRLYNGKFINMDSDGKSSTFNFEKTDFNLSKFGTKTTTYRKLQETSIIELLTCLNYIYIKKEIYVEKYLTCNKESIDETVSEVYKRIFKPFYLFLLSSVVIFLVVSNHEKKGYTSFKFLIFSIGIFVIIISEISVSFAGQSSLKFLISILSPLIIFLISYLFFYKRANYTNSKI
jgi:lipopolysaccharide export system permease protein